MASIRDYFFDTTLLTETLAYLADQHQLTAAILDSAGNEVFQHGPARNGASHIHPFHFSRELGGLRCAADDEQTLASAAPHIAFALTVLHTQLEREVELRETTDEMLQLSSQLNFLFKLAQKIIGIDDLARCYEIILHEIARAIGADHAMLTTKGRWEENIEASYNLTPDQRAAIESRPSFKNAAGSGTIIFTCEDGASLLYSPIKEKEGQSGYVVFARTREHRFFSAYEKKFVSIIENIISPTFETLRLYDSLQDLYLNTVKALAAAIDAKDEYTHGHSFRVAQYAIAIGHHLDIDQKQLNDLEIAAYMHDLGKIGISETILGKPGKLTPAEFSEIQRHPEFTDKILQPIKLPAFIVDAAVQHHERLDGTGYPLGLNGENISFFARIIAVADVFDALTSKRPYREALSVEEALRILCDDTDVKFDRTVVLAFLHALGQEERRDEMLSIINISLHFAAIKNLNTFLVELTDFISEKKALPPSA